MTKAWVPKLLSLREIKICTDCNGIAPGRTVIKRRQRVQPGPLGRYGKVWQGLQIRWSERQGIACRPVPRNEPGYWVSNWNRFNGKLEKAQKSVGL